MATSAPNGPGTPPPIQGEAVHGIAIHHADEALVVCEKPAGLLAVPGRGEAGRDSVFARLQARWPGLEIVHRLDMATSGLMVFARGKAAGRTLGMAFAARAVHKRYVAVVQGRVPDFEGWREIDLPLGADWPNRPRQQVDLERGKPSLTRYRVLDRDDDHDRTRLALEPVTGRSHQLRVHLMAIGFPVVGDALYAGGQTACARLLLHAAELALPHPARGETLRFRSEPDF